MDPEKHRYSLALPRDDSASGFSALRSSTRSPSFRRLSLRKSRSSSCSTTDSASIRSTESHISPQSSCVTRDIPRNECAFHRFMIWVAVKRNECERMTPTERLECPLLRCRKRFMNHEQMLRHLYACDELDSGEYWCYDCERPERFTDAQCKRCLGHPKKRRKILSMAKNFFTSLGHKSRKEGLLRSLPEDDALVPPPSYDSLDLHLTNELCSAGEIHEIDSTEVPPVSIAAPAPAPATMHNTPPLSEPEPPLFLSSTIQQPPPPCIFPAELDTRISFATPHESAIESWINDPIAYVPSEDSGRRHSTEEQRMKTRSKTLAPSSSLRSNASNSSTNTTNTTNSTDSTNTVSTGISPSIWSEPWTIASGFGTELESPISNFLCPSKFHDENVNMGSCDNAFDGDVFMRDFIPELPADLPLLTPLPNSSDNLAVPQDIISLGAPTAEGDDPAITTYSNADLLLDVTNAIPNSSAEASPSSDPRSPLSSSVEPPALVSAILETLQAHVSSSEAKLRPMRDNGLAAQFLAIDSRTVASYGHATLKAKLQGRPPDSTLHLLCYVHVVYAYFLVLHQEEAGTHSQGLFPQALAYATGLALPSQPEYLEIAHAIWEPDDLGEAVSTKPDTLQLGSRDPFSTTLSAVRKGKGPCDGVPVKDDALLTVSQYLLDEFECSILACNPCSSDEVLSSELFMSHATAGSLAPPAKTNTPPAFWNVIGNTVNNAIRRFGSRPGLTSALQFASQRISKGYPSARKAELELLQAAHGCIPLTTIVNGYAPFIRDQCEALYSIQPTDLAWRPTYYSQVIDLIESMVSSLVPTQYTLKSPDTSDIDEFLALPTPFMDSSAGVSPECAATWGSLSTNTPAVFSNNVSKADASSGQPSPHGDHREPDLSTPQSGPGDGEPQPATQKVEADACCEICGYRPRGHPQWFKGSMAKHKKLQHSAKPPKIYKCSYPGCTSQYKNRQDNLRQHKLDKGHFIDGEEEMMHKRPSKRKKL